VPDITSKFHTIATFVIVTYNEHFIQNFQIKIKVKLSLCLFS